MTTDGSSAGRGSGRATPARSSGGPPFSASSVRQPGRASGSTPSEEDEEAMAARGGKSFYDKAQEATMATMSVLVGAGMAALPFLIGT